MGKDNVKRILVWEKVADFLMDIAKYVLMDYRQVEPAYF